MATKPNPSKPTSEETKVAIYSRHLEKLADRHGGELTAELVRNDAQRAQSPIHDWFEWDKNKAAYQYQLEQARQLIRLVYTVVRDEQAPEHTVKIRRYEHVAGSYKRTDAVLANQSWREELLMRLARDIAALRTRYSAYSQLGATYDAVDQHLSAAETAAKSGTAA